MANVECTLNNNNVFTFAHLDSAWEFLSHGICTQIGFPTIRSKFELLVEAQ